MNVDKIHLGPNTKNMTIQQEGKYPNCGITIHFNFFISNETICKLFSRLIFLILKNNLIECCQIEKILFPMPVADHIINDFSPIDKFQSISICFFD